MACRAESSVTARGSARRGMPPGLPRRSASSSGGATDAACRSRVRLSSAAGRPSLAQFDSEVTADHIGGPGFVHVVHDGPPGRLELADVADVDDGEVTAGLVFVRTGDDGGGAAGACGAARYAGMARPWFTPGVCGGQAAGMTDRLAARLSSGLRVVDELAQLVGLLVEPR